MPSDTLATRFDGRYTSGETAGSEEVGVRLEERGLAIVKPGATEPLIWPYSALGSGEPFGKHAIDALVTYRDQPGATLFVPGSAFVRKLSEHAPHLTSRAQRWRAARPWLYVSACAILIVFVVWAAGLSPARTVASMLPDKIRKTMGKQIVTAMSEGRGVCLDEKGRAALDKLAKRLSDASGSAASFNIVVVNWGLLNAFAAPGEQIVVTRRLITTAKSPDELAAVIAHEMGHGIEFHPEASLVRGIGMTAAAELLLGGGSGSLVNIGILLAQLSYSRDAEREADLHGLRILKSAGISSQGMTDFFDRVSKIERGTGKDGKTEIRPDTDGSALDILRTHPPTRERILRVKSQGKYEATPALSKSDWEDLKLICQDLPEPAKKGSKKDKADK